MCLSRSLDTPTCEGRRSRIDITLNGQVLWETTLVVRYPLLRDVEEPIRVSNGIRHESWLSILKRQAKTSFLPVWIMIWGSFIILLLTFNVFIFLTSQGPLSNTKNLYLSIKTSILIYVRVHGLLGSLTIDFILVSNREKMNLLQTSVFRSRSIDEF